MPARSHTPSGNPKPHRPSIPPRAPPNHPDVVELSSAASSPVKHSRLKKPRLSSTSQPFNRHVVSERKRQRRNNTADQFKLVALAKDDPVFDASRSVKRRALRKGRGSTGLRSQPVAEQSADDDVVVVSSKQAEADVSTDDLECVGDDEVRNNSNPKQYRELSHSLDLSSDDDDAAHSPSESKDVVLSSSTPPPSPKPATRARRQPSSPKRSPPLEKKRASASGTVSRKRPLSDGDVQLRPLPSRTRNARAVEVGSDDSDVEHVRKGRRVKRKTDVTVVPTCAEKKRVSAGPSWSKAEARSTVLTRRKVEEIAQDVKREVKRVKALSDPDYMKKLPPPIEIDDSPPRQKRKAPAEEQVKKQSSPIEIVNSSERPKRRAPALRSSPVVNAYQLRSRRLPTLKEAEPTGGETDIRFKTANEEEIKEITNMTKGRGDTVVSKIELASISLKKQDFRCLRPTAWLSDEVINSFLALVNERNMKYFESRSKEVDQKELPSTHEKKEGTPVSNDAVKVDSQNSNSSKGAEKADLYSRGRPRTYIFSTFFLTRLCGPKYKYSTVRRWLIKAGHNILDLDLVMVPINIENVHWVLVAVDLRGKSFIYFDSNRLPDCHGYIPSIRRWLEDEVRDKCGEEKLKELNIRSWDVTINPPDVPIQTDSFSCGIFAIYIAEFLERGLRPTFTQQNVAALRQRTALFLKHGLPE